MTYRNRIKKPSRQLTPSYWWYSDLENFERGKRLLGGTFHKAPYVKKGYKKSVNLFTGKYNGWHDSPFKWRGLKKRHRQENKKLILAELQLM